jgi:hypothetical protein
LPKHISAGSSITYLQKYFFVTDRRSRSRQVSDPVGSDGRGNPGKYVRACFSILPHVFS